MSELPLPELAARPIEAIVIGASAGGVEALSEILPALRRGAAVATMVVLHLPRERPSLLAQIFADRCRQPVVEAQDKEPAQAGVIHFAPPDYHLLVDRSEDGPILAMSNDELVNYSRPAIDVLFESAADVYGPRLLGILLTGGNHDGAAGMQAIARAGGVTVVQSPQQAQVPYMPAQALAMGNIDYVLTLQQIADLLRTLGASGLAQEKERR
ncbi:chemotaxis protein CheB [Herbaspirillum seropedicae]|uniref:protein-glutamate methylesterase n=1 Tax=Herbaspirillum seropedicae (strain SmR1) TaxID=757424 RepID=D8J276_HERSS|nr:chemotaxis protein CheB [Herbaspirillum seropedicae]ADJ64859.1 protein-glutamate methylesterase protein [Herbaspirillum seropedicae SmR1]AKN66761.1 chemotaxis protein CheB [Herbaspirillum seropedicae]AON55650.1 protein-glutamate methylesterase [Herbaspirillum seropedicae]NQE28243.1 chemotaxis protein CheB [Herbaspirillum seropedicae]UMU22753.1 chemotaxis protein CheB [Herbaspirillum seropedicae]